MTTEQILSLIALIGVFGAFFVIGYESAIYSAKILSKTE
jgi:hypothetical protein